MNAPDATALAIAEGLTEREAAVRLEHDGPNELPALGRRNIFEIAIGVLSEPMFALLLAASAIYLTLGDFAEAVALSLFATFSVSIALIQELRSERVLAALRDLTSPRALVIRDGRQRRIPGREVVRDDIILLAEGDRVPADAWIVSGHDISVDESLLTGESVPVRKRPAPAERPQALRPGGDDLACAFSGTLIVRGHGRARVTATGAASEIGKIGGALGRIRVEAPRLQAETRRIVRAFAMAGAAVSLAAGLLYGFATQSLLNGLLSGIAVGMSMLPEEFPLVLAVFMVMGAWRIAQARVLTRRASSIETLGSVTVLCADKTGTLTENRMSVAHAEADGEIWDRSGAGVGDAFSPAIHHLFHFATLAGLRDAFDPMERALQELWRHHDPTLDALYGTRELAEHHGIAPDRLVMTQVWRALDDGTILAAAKGAPEAVAEMCRLSPERTAGVLQRASLLASRGMRVLAVAASDGAGHDRRFDYLGLVAFEDPIRANVPEAVREARQAGIRVLMITGDFPATARTIAQQAGIEAAEAMSGDELQRLGDAELRSRVRTCDVYARIMPEQKLRIVEALKANGEVVGMTGDGVNDAPSLRAAHIGIAMGGRGTDVAREAASIVLLDDDFGSIVKTIRLGRRIYDNLRKAMGYILAVHVPIAGLSLLPLVFGGPLILTPALIAFLEMIIDPACSVVFEAEKEEDNVMLRPPRDPQSTLLNRSLVATSLSLGALAFLAVGTVFVIARELGGSESDLRTLALVSLVTTNIALIFAHRSFDTSARAMFGRPNRWLWFGVAGVAASLTVVLVTPLLREVFRLAPLHADDIALSFTAAAVFVVAAWGLRHLAPSSREKRRQA